MCVSGIDMCLYLARKVSTVCVSHVARKVSSHVQCVLVVSMYLYLARKVSSHVQCVLVVSICVCT